jgi:hypothetical protein
MSTSIDDRVGSALDDECPVKKACAAGTEHQSLQREGEERSCSRLLSEWLLAACGGP